MTTMPDYVRAALAAARIAIDNARKSKDRPVRSPRAETEDA